MIPAFLQPIFTWIGRSLLVKFGVGAVGVGAGAAAAVAAGSRSSSSSIQFNGLAWGEWSGQELLDEVEIHWNDNGMGNGEAMEGPCPSVVACTPGSKMYASKWTWWKGIWGWSDFTFKVHWDYDGCNITNLYFTTDVGMNNIRSAITKIAIQKIRIEPTDEYIPDLCGCTDNIRPIIYIPGGAGNSEEGESAESTGNEPTAVTEQEAPCCCKPAVIKIVLSLQFLNFGFISNDAYSSNRTIIIAANGEKRGRNS